MITWTVQRCVTHISLLKRHLTARPRGWASSTSPVFQRSCLHPTQRHLYGQAIENGSKEEARLPGPKAEAQAAVVIAHRPSETSPEDVISQLQPISEGFGPSLKAGSTLTAIFLVTPSLAHWLYDDDLFVAKALRRLWQDKTAEQENEQIVQTLVAVVDSVPGPGLVETEEHEEISVVESKQSPIAPSGFEGLAFLASSSSTFCPNLLSPETEHDSTSSNRSDKQGSITFRFRTPRVHNSLFVPGSAALGRRIELPLASTIFTTGHASLMYASQWQRLSGSQEFSMLQKREKLHQEINVPMRFLRHPARTTLTVPLVPLTMPREIKACMGNIIRTVLTRGTSTITVPAVSELVEAVVPASTELEKSVTSYFDARGIAPYPISAWALVIPQELAQAEFSKGDSAALSTLYKDASLDQAADQPIELHDLWAAPRPIADPSIKRFIEKGASLRRVLSGGGGWGKKAGLLSLDPGSSYQAPVTDPSRFRQTSLEPALEDQQAVISITEVGDYIQFFIAPVAVEDENQAHDAQEQNTKRRTSLVFGTIPSTMDRIPGDAASADTEQQRPKLELVDEHFGMLSATGMSVKVEEFKAAPGLPVRRREIITTKVDVPFTRFSVVRYQSPDDPPGVVAEEPQVCPESMSVPVESFGQIVGIGASNLKLLEDESGCQIFPLPKHNARPRTRFLILIGSPETREAAKSLVNELVSDPIKRGAHQIRAANLKQRFHVEDDEFSDTRQEDLKKPSLVDSPVSAEDVQKALSSSIQANIRKITKTYFRKTDPSENNPTYVDDEGTVRTRSGGMRPYHGGRLIRKYEKGTALAQEPSDVQSEDSQEVDEDPSTIVLVDGSHSNTVKHWVLEGRPNIENHKQGSFTSADPDTDTKSYMDKESFKVRKFIKGNVVVRRLGSGKKKVDVRKFIVSNKSDELQEAQRKHEDWTLKMGKVERKRESGLVDDLNEVIGGLYGPEND